MGKVHEWSEVARWERCVSGLRWQGGKGGRIVRWHDRRGGNVMRWQFGKGGRVVSMESWDGIYRQNSVLFLQGSKI